MQDINDNIQADVEAINRISIIPSILNVICKTTGMGFAAIARVTEDKWVTCSVQDEISFGLKPGDELEIETTFCNKVRQTNQEIVIDHVDKDQIYATHPIPAMYGFQSYISVPIFRKDGSFFGTLCSIDPMPAKLKSTQIKELFYLFTDLIAFHLHTLDQLDLAEAQLLEEKRTSELREQFIAILGHDLRNPLTSIKMISEALHTRLSDSKEKKLINNIKTSSYRMEGLIGNLLDFARARLGGGINLNLSRHNDSLKVSLQQVLKEIKTMSPNQEIKIYFDLSEPVTCDKNRVAQLFSNLLGNAVTHGTANAPVIVKAISTKDSFKLSVANSGSKIPENEMERLFQPYFRQSKNSEEEGLGLGLYTASEIALAHQGNIDVESSDEETCFTFQMPSNLNT